jgi:predicted permease
MPWLRYFRRRYWDRERAREIADYLDRETADNVARGMTPGDARAAARRKFGNPTLVREEIYRMNTFTWLETLAQDLRYALRVLRRTPGFTTVAVLSLALGVGANTTVFSVVNAVVLRPLPYLQPDRLVVVSGDVRVPEFEFWKENAASFASAGGNRGVSERRLTVNNHDETIGAMTITSDYFRTLGVPLELGREFDAQETRSTGPQAVVLADGLWRRAFGGDPGILGRAITLNNRSYNVVGVLPASFWSSPTADAFLPLRPTGSVGDRGTNTTMIARLKPGVSLSQANAEMPAMVENLRRARPDPDYPKERPVTLMSLHESLTGSEVRTNLLLLLAAVGLLLLIACANLGGLLLARFSARQKEIAVRLALGSGGARLLRQFLIEGMLLATAGTVAGVLGAYWSLDALLAFVPFHLVSAAPVRLDLTVLAFAAAVALATGIAFSLPAFFTAARLNLHETLKAAGRANSGSRQHARSVLVVGEVAVSVTLLVSAALMIQSLYRLHREQLGFSPANLLTFSTRLAEGGFRTAAEQAAFVAAASDRLRTIPGVRSVAITNVVPLDGYGNFPVQQEGAPTHSIGGMEVRVVTPGYFDTMGIRVLRGRGFTTTDTAGAPLVAVVSESVARQWWPDAGDPLSGKALLGYMNGRAVMAIPDPSRAIVGVVADTKRASLKEPARPTIYVAGPQAGWETDGMRWMLRGAASAQQISAAIAAADPRVRVERLRTMESLVARGTANTRFDAWLFGSFAALALLLTAIGVYGVLAFSVGRRIHEIGTRMALGASRPQVLRMVLLQGALLIGLGLVLGLAGAFALTRSLSTLLFGVKPNDPLSFALVAVVLCAAGLFASYMPARRATKIDPMMALRYE